MIKDVRERYIVTPLDKKSLDELNFGEEASNCSRLDLSDDEFLCLYKSGILDEINIKLNVFVDDYEQVAIFEKDKLDGLLLIVNDYCSWHQFSLKRILSKLSLEIDKAIRNETGIFFMF